MAPLRLIRGTDLKEGSSQLSVLTLGLCVDNTNREMRMSEQAISLDVE